MPRKPISIGCDPEFFLKKKEGTETGKYICAIPFIKGTKEEPQKLPSGCGNVQFDNVAVEFATTPAMGLKDWIDKIRATIEDVSKVIPTDCSLNACPSAVFTEDQLTDPEAHRFGCEPDYNAWTLVENDAPCAADPNFRSCGAHIHVGTEPGDENEFLLEIEGKVRVVRTMDCVHGMISTILDHSPEAISRRQLYGKAGAHRPKEYGVEYRSLSNFWMKSPKLVMLMYFATQDVLEIVRTNKDLDLVDAIGGGDRVQKIVNEGLVEDAMQVLNEIVRPLLSEETASHLDMAMEEINAYDDTLIEWSKEESYADLPAHMDK